MCSEKPIHASTPEHTNGAMKKNSSDKCCYAIMTFKCRYILSNLVFLKFSFFIVTDLVVLLITYENDGVFRVAELGDHYRLLLK